MKEKILTKLMELRSDDLAAMEFAAGRSVEMIKAYCNIAVGLHHFHAASCRKFHGGKVILSQFHEVC